MSDLTFKEFQKYIKDNYHEKDSKRGTSGNFMWLIEEIGELSSALQHCSNPEKEPSETDRKNLEEEFADVLGWLSTLANIHGVDLERALYKKYLCRSKPDTHKA